MKVSWMIKASKSYGIKLSTQYGQKRVSVYSRVVGLRILIDYFLYPANNSNRTQRMGRGLPNGQGTTLPSSWVQDDPTAGYEIHEKRHQNDVDILI